MFKKKFVVSNFNSTHGYFEVCIKNDKIAGSLGVWLGDNPFDFLLPVTLCQMIVAISASQMLYFVLRPLQTPKFICSVLGGILLGPTFLGHNHVVLNTLFPIYQASFLIILSKIGAIYYIFITSLKMDITTTLKAGKCCWRFAVIPYFISSFVTAYLLSLYKPNGDGGSHSIPNVFTVSSFAVVFEALLELNLITTELGQIALYSAMIGEILQWGTVAVYTYKTDGIFFSLGFLICTCLFILWFIYIVRPMMKKIVQRTPKGKPVREMDIIMIILGVLVMAAISDAIGLYFIIGPMLYGLAMPNGAPLATTIIEKSETLIHHFLMPFFYMYIGLNTYFGGITKNWKKALVFQSILFVGFMVKVIACVLVSPTYNIQRRHGVALGLILSIKGITELIYFSRLKKVQIIDEEIFSEMVLYVVLMTAICIPLIKYLYKHRARVLTTPSIHERRVRTIQNAPENNEFNIISCVHNDGNVRSMIALLEAFNPTQESPINVYVIHLIELLGKSTPILLPMHTQNNRSLSTNYPDTNHILRAFENYSKNSKGAVTVLSYINVAPYNNIHEAVCNLSEDRLVHFLILPFHENDQTVGCNSNINKSIRDLNTNFQSTAQCTVGIIVDRCSRLNMMNPTKLSFNVGIFFLGGPDDREALALGIRMMNLERPNMRITVFRFVMPDNNNNYNNKDICLNKTFNGDDERLEHTLDESLFDEFRAKKMKNNNVSFHEIMVEDCMQVLQVIRGLRDEDYDLVMVGKRHNMGNVTDEEMVNFMDYADQLGIYGDMLASTEFCNGRVSVLVLQCGDKRVKQSDKVGVPQVTYF